MKIPHLILYLSLFCLFSSFDDSQDCEHAGSNITYIQKETQKALENKDLQVVRFHIYKALDALSKSDKQLADCNCTHAVASIEEASVLLKKATKTTSVSDTHNLLNRTLAQISEALEGIRKHDQHIDPNRYNTPKVNEISRVGKDTILHSPQDDTLLKERIDASLESYKASLDKVIQTVGCKEAHLFATNIYENCEQQLLRNNLSEGKKYYNLRTKEITGDALIKLGNCATQ